MLRITNRAVGEILAEAWRVYPKEGCGLLLAAEGSGSAGTVRSFLPVDNVARSSRIFQLDPKGFLRAERFGDDHQLEVVGVMHSHTHTAAYPSATDVDEATKPLVPPTWHWLIVSLGFGAPEIRSFSLQPSHGNFGENSAAGIAEETLLLTR